MFYALEIGLSLPAWAVVAVFLVRELSYGRRRSIALSWLPSNPSATALEMAGKI